MTYVRAAVDNRIWLDSKRMPNRAVQAICEELTIDNQEYLKALELGLPEADDLEPYFELFDYEGDWLVLPRGFASQLVEGCEALDIELRWQDERQSSPGLIFDLGKEIPVRSYQDKIVMAVGEAHQGIIKAPTGSGKTVAALEIFRIIRGNALVIVNTKEIAQQWVDRIEQWLGEDYPVGFIGDGEFEITVGINIAIQATLWSRFEKLKEEGFFKRFRAVCLDECHHATAETYNIVVNEFNAEYRFGMSATPDKTGTFELSQAVLGPIIVEITEEDVADQILKPDVHVWETEFGMNHGGDKTNQGFRRADYETILKALVSDDQRTQRIVDVLMEEHYENANLVLSKRLGHLSNIWEALVANGYPQERIFTIAGMDSRAARKETVAATEEANCVVLSTLADEALDAPRLDRLFITFPTANAKLVQQQVGRIRRKHPDKEDAVVVDFRDWQVKQLNRQYMTRRHQVYNPLGFKVIKRKDNQ